MGSCYNNSQARICSVLHHHLHSCSTPFAKYWKALFYIFACSPKQKLFYSQLNTARTEMLSCIHHDCLFPWFKVDMSIITLLLSPEVSAEWKQLSSTILTACFIHSMTTIRDRLHILQWLFYLCFYIVCLLSVIKIASALRSPRTMSISPTSLSPSFLLPCFCVSPMYYCFWSNIKT